MPAIEELDFNVHEALTFASLVERETASEEQRQQISGVFYNRLEAEMPLQTDPTVLYALGEHNEVVTYEDLEIDSRTTHIKSLHCQLAQLPILRKAL